MADTQRQPLFQFSEILEEEVKRDLSFSEDGTTVGYKNYKTYYFDAPLSCKECDYNRTLWMPSLIGVGTLEDMQDPKYNLSTTAKYIIEYTMLLLGEYPFIQVQFGKMVFDGYADSLLSAAHSPVIKWISDKFNNGTSIIPIPVPDMPVMAMFYNYNNTNDESYVIDTGKADVEKMGQVREWAGMDLLPEDWWSDKQARMLNGTDSGSFVKSGISEGDKPQLFNSFMCRSFTMEFAGKTTTKGIPTVRFQSTHETFDTTLPQNAGFRYANYEGINYYPGWGNKSLVDGTYLLPPG
ncbi:Protein SCAV-6, partial [Aphelenchoides avenae]